MAALKLSILTTPLNLNLTNYFVIKRVIFFRFLHLTKKRKESSMFGVCEYKYNYNNIW